MSILPFFLGTSSIYLARLQEWFILILIKMCLYVVGSICAYVYSLAEWGAREQAPIHDGHVLDNQMRTGCKGGTWEHDLGLQGWCQKSQSLVRIEMVRDVAGDKKTFYSSMNN